MYKALFIIFIFSLYSSQIMAGDVVITVDRFKHNTDAPVRFSICDNEKCHQMRDKGYKPVEIEDVQLIEVTEIYRKYIIKNLKPGEYSLSAYHDLNNNGKLERSGILGVPQEPVGFSRLDVQRIWSHPKWDEVKFSVGTGTTSVNVHLVHEFGIF